ncbi:SDR family oxidoreductase [Burkholderia gladioli]|uniref:SDR family oxidoreductase n=1 Tax=Burkholderia gladioli TaxID=28095 RepID=UPI000CFE6F35|nr:SDR family oxidoreductase [Burkholderia gladioli]PRG51614.1 NAD-dependent dehydratase [Burkholderia gladioli]
MRIFLTGATGFIGSYLIPELISHGHQVLGLSRSDNSARRLLDAGAEVHRGSLDDIDGLRRAAVAVDAVIHCAYDHDFSRPEEIARLEAGAIEAFGTALAGSERPLVITSVCGMGAEAPRQLATESGFNPHNPRSSTEQAGRAASAKGANVSIVRLAQVHDTARQGFVSALVGLAREKGVSGFVGDGENRWAAVHVEDAARLYRLAVEKAAPRGVYHAVGEDGVSLKSIAAAIGERLDVPVQSLLPEAVKAHFGWLEIFAGMDMSASSTATQQRLNWVPQGPGLLEDLSRLPLTVDQGVSR